MFCGRDGARLRRPRQSCAIGLRGAACVPEGFCGRVVIQLAIGTIQEKNNQHARAIDARVLARPHKPASQTHKTRRHTSQQTRKTSQLGWLARPQRANCPQRTTSTMADDKNYGPYKVMMVCGALSIVRPPKAQKSLLRQHSN